MAGFLLFSLGPAVYAQCGCGSCGSGCGSKSCGSDCKSAAAYTDNGSGGTITVITEPYGGQVYCPVTGQKLGLHGAPIPVQTTVGEVKPSWLEKLRGKQPTPGAVVYVCCRDCVAKVQANPQVYLREANADRAVFSSYASAPAQRPDRVSTAANLVIAPQTPIVAISATVNQAGTETNRLAAPPVGKLYEGQKTCPVTEAALGSMGPPIPVAVKGQTIYVCCQSCIAKVQANPDVYLAHVAAERNTP